MFWRSSSVSGCRDVFGGVGKVEDGKLMLRRAWRPGMALMVVGLKVVQGRIWRMSHQKCLVFVSRMWMLIWRTKAGAGLGEVRYAIMDVLLPSSMGLSVISSRQMEFWSGDGVR